jgi:predicted nucleic acid-binding protein
VIVADTGALLALIDAGDRHHAALLEVWEAAPEAWVLPWAVLPEVDYLLLRELGPKAEETFLADLARGLFTIAWGEDEDLESARRVCARYRSLKLGLVDGVVIALAERLRANAIATLDLKHFGAVSIRGNPKLIPRDL